MFRFLVWELVTQVSLFDENPRATAAAAAAESLHLCPTLFDPIDGSPPGSSVHGIFQATVLEWGAIAFSNPRAIHILTCIVLYIR